MIAYYNPRSRKRVSTTSRRLLDTPSPREQVRMLSRCPCPVCGVVDIVGEDDDGVDLDERGLVSARCGCGEEWTLLDCASDLGLATVVTTEGRHSCVTLYRVTAHFERDGQIISCDQAEVLGEAHGVTYETEEDAQQAADDCQDLLDETDLDPSTHYEVERVVVDAPEVQS